MKGEVKGGNLFFFENSSAAFVGSLGVLGFHAVTSRGGRVGEREREGERERGERERGERGRERERGGIERHTERETDKQTGGEEERGRDRDRQ